MSAGPPVDCGHAGAPRGAKFCPRCGAPLQNTADYMAYVGQTIDNRYEILQCIAKGGSAVVFRARHRLLKRDVALKFLQRGVSRGSPELDFFVNEAVLAMKLVHESILQVRDFGLRGDNEFYMVMDYSPGLPLSRVIADAAPGTIEVSRALDLFDQVLGAVGYAHSFDVVHRDLKPGNVMVEGEPPRERAKVLDFGVAKLIGETDHDRWIAGTPEYMSPEQHLGNPPDVTSDVFSLGVTLYELLTGRLPFRARDRTTLVRSILDGSAPPILSLAPSLPPLVAGAAMRAISPDPEDRFPSAEEFRGALRPARQPGFDQEAALERIVLRDRAATVLHVESFDRPDRWEGRDHEVSAGQLRLRGILQGARAILTDSAVRSLPDFLLHVRVGYRGGPVTARYSLVLGLGGPDIAVHVELSGDGYFGISHRSPSRFHLLHERTPSLDIRTGRGAENEIEVVVAGGRLSLHVNGVPLGGAGLPRAPTGPIGFETFDPDLDLVVSDLVVCGARPSAGGGDRG